MLEKNLQLKIIQYAQTRGCVAVKVNAESVRGFPDLIVFIKGGTSMLVEVKSPKKTGRLDPMQVHVHKKLAAVDTVVEVIDNIQRFKYLLDTRMGAYKRGFVNADT